MTTQTTTIQSSTKVRRTSIGAAAASLAVLVGVLLWQGRPASETAAPGTTTSSSEQAAPRWVAQTEGGAIYLTGSPAQADALRAALDQDAAYGQEVNAPPAPAAAVTVIASEQDLARLLRLAGAADEVNAAYGLPLLQIVDRRAS